MYTTSKAAELIYNEFAARVEYTELEDEFNENIYDNYRNAHKQIDRIEKIMTDEL